MRHKKVQQYALEQTLTIDKLITVISPLLDDENRISLYDLERNEPIKNAIIGLIPSIKKYFAVSNSKALTHVEDSKRPYVVAIKQALKGKYKILTTETYIDGEKGKVKSRFYHLIKNDLKV